MEILEYKCPCCGGKLEFNSSLQKMKCPYCDTEFDTENLKNYDDALNRQNQQTEKMDWEVTPDREWNSNEMKNVRVYTCQSCGGEIICDNNTAASACPFCDSPVIMSDNLGGVLRPDYVIPFKLDKKAAKEAFIKHLTGKKFLPKVFKEENHIDEIKGVYVPFWLFDADALANMSYRATKVRVWMDKRYEYTETRFFHVIRGGSIGFEHIPVDGSSKIDLSADMMESLEPFDFKDAVDFQTAYLSGYMADKYDVDADSTIQRANERIRKSVEENFRQTVQGYNTVKPEQSNINLKNSEAKYALYPVWLLNTTWNGQKYTFAMNGQTGKFVGNLPLDKNAYWSCFGKVAGAVAAASMLILSLIWLI